MNVYQNKNLNELQICLLDMLKWYHQFCVENDLKYYIIGGTMLGAVRHKGFIPWDDDIDVGMPREDYNKFIQLLEKKSNNRYILETPYSEAKDYIYAFCKIYDVNTTLIENYKFEVKRGVYLDIFPLDGVANTEREASQFIHKIVFLLNLIALKISAIRKGRSFYKNLLVYIFRIVPNFIFSEKRLIIRINNICNEKEFYNNKYGGNLFGQWQKKEIMETSIYGEPQLYDFEGIQVYGVEKPEEYLTNLYGNWKQLPPLEKQVSHHDFIAIDLNKSYLEK